MSTPVLVESLTYAQPTPCKKCGVIRTREHFEYTINRESYAPCCLFCLPKVTRVDDEFELHERLSPDDMRKYYGSVTALYQVVTRYRLACIQEREYPAFAEHVIKVLTYQQWQKLKSSNRIDDQVPETVDRILVLS